MLNEILSRGGELKTTNIISFKNTPKSKVDSNAQTEKQVHKRKTSVAHAKKNLSLGYESNNNTAFSGEHTIDINDIEVGLQVEPINYK